MSASLKKNPRVGGRDNFLIPQVGSWIFFTIPVGGCMVGTPPPPNILCGDQISLNPYFSRGFTHLYIKIGVGKQKGRG